MQLAEINKEIVGLIFNNVLVTKVTDGTMDTVSDVIYRYKFRTKTGYHKDGEEKTVIRESPVPLYGARIDGRQLGTELIDIRPANPNDKQVWWVVNPVFQPRIIDRDAVTKRPITVQKLVNPTHCVGTYQEFLDVVNSQPDSAKPDIEDKEYADVPGEALDEDAFTDDDVDFIKANYMTMTDKEMAKVLEADVPLLRDYRLKTLKLKKR